MIKVYQSNFLVSSKNIIWHLKYLLIFISLCIHNNSTSANPRTPSQALPDFFKRHSQPDFFDFKDTQKAIPEIPNFYTNSLKFSNTTLFKTTVPPSLYSFIYFLIYPLMSKTQHIIRLK